MDQRGGEAADLKHRRTPRLREDSCRAVGGEGHAGLFFGIASAAHPATGQEHLIAEPFVFERSGRIYFVDREGGSLRQLAVGSYPDWAGGRIADFSLGGVGKRTGIFVMDTSGANDRYVGDGFYSSLSPNGRSVVIARDANLYVHDLDGLDAPRLLATPPAGWEFLSEPSWSPDGSRIAFAVCKSYIDQWDVGSVCGQIHTVPPDGSAPPTALSTEASSMKPMWSPDGSALAYQSGGSIHVYRNGQSTFWISGLGPSWTSDGRLVFMGFDSRLKILDNGIVRQIVPTDPNGPKNYQDRNFTMY